MKGTRRDRELLVEVEELLAHWQEVFGLRDHHIMVEVVDKAANRDGILAAVTTPSPYDTSYMEITRSTKGQDRYTTLEDTIVHELIHIAHATAGRDEILNTITMILETLKIDKKAISRIKECLGDLEEATVARVEPIVISARYAHTKGE